MNALLVVASRHGSTTEIGDIVDRELAKNGVEVERYTPDSVASVSGYDAVIIGSGVYASRWLKSARSFIDKYHEQLVDMTVWLFSSGPTQDEPIEDTSKFAAIDDIIQKVQPSEHRVFAGNIDKSKLNLGEKAIIKMVKAPYGDFRDETAIKEWTADISKQISK